MDLTELERLFEIVQNANIRELTLRQGEQRLTLKKPASSGVPGGDLVVYQEGYRGEDDDVMVSSYAPVDSEEEGPTPTVVTSPLVGVYHPAKPLVGLGARVTAGQVIGVIEAMKLVTEVTASGEGVVVETLIEDGMPVEYGQPLFIIQPGLAVH